MDNPFVVDSTGITTPKMQAARARAVELYKGIHGNDAQTASDSPDGQIIDWLTLLIVLIWEGNAGIYAAAFLRTASGTQLDLLLDLFGRIRLAARPSTAGFVLYGTASSVVPLGTVASVESSQRRFASDETITIGASDLSRVVLIKTASNALAYQVTINGTPFSYTPGAGETTEQVRDGLEAAINLGAEPVAAFDGGVDEDGAARLVLDATSAGQTFTSANSSTDLEIYSAERVAATAEQTGPITASAGDLDVVQTPSVGLVGITTTADATIGRNEETDAEFRQRHLATLRSGGLATPLAIRDRILEFVPTVRSARVFENESDTTNGDGLPPHSFEAVVLSEPIAAPTDDAEIAAQILVAKPAGIQSFGAVLQNLPDPQGFGNVIPIRFSRPTVRYLHLDIEITPGEGFPSIGEPDEEIKAAVVAWLSVGGGGELGLGSDLVRFQLGEPIAEAVAGIQTATIETDDTPNPGDPPTFTPSDISVADDEILVVDSSRVTVTIL